MNQNIKFIIPFLCFTLLFSEESKIKIINYNIHGFGFKKISKKIDSIINKINNYDLLFLQENWSFSKKIKNSFKKHNIFFGRRKTNTLFDSGLVTGIKKKFEVIEHENISFETCSGWLFNGSDCFASKGFTFIRLKKNNNIIDIYNTHLDAGNSKKDQRIRSNQINKLKNFILSTSLENPIFICGDFNFNYNLYPSQIDSFVNEISLESYNSNLDYIFYRDSNNVKFKIKEFDLSEEYMGLSDHLPMGIEVEIIK